MNRVNIRSFNSGAMRALKEHAWYVLFEGVHYSIDSLESGEAIDKELICQV